MKITVTLKNGSVYKIHGNARSFLNNKELQFLGRFITRSESEEDFGTMVALLIESMGDQEHEEVSVISTLIEPMGKMYYTGGAEENLLDIARDIEVYLGEER